MTIIENLHTGNNYTTEELLAYINGFLKAIECLNIFSDHGSTFFIEKIERLSDYRTSVSSNLSGRLVELNEVEEWQNALTRASKYYFKSFYDRINVLTDNSINKSQNKELRYMLDIEEMLKQYLRMIGQLMTNNSKFFEVFVEENGTFYECEYNDFLIDSERGLFFIHLGYSD